MVGLHRDYCRSCILGLLPSLERWAQGANARVIAERLGQLIKESGDFTHGIGIYGIHGARDGMEEIVRIKGQRRRVMDFLEVHFGPEAVARFEKQGTRGLEELLAEYLGKVAAK